MLANTEIKLYTWEEYEQVCEIVGEGSPFEYVEGQIFWRYSQEIMPIDLIDFVLSKTYTVEKFSQFLESYHLMKASKEHQIIAINLNMQIVKQLDDEKLEYIAETANIAIPNQDKSRVSDGTFTGKDKIFNKKNQLTNPKATIEIWSPSTEKIDKTEKLDEYRSIESLEEYLMFSQDEPKAEQYIRKSKNTWENNIIEGLDKTVAMPSVNVSLSMEKVYKGVEFKKKKK